MLFLLMGDHTLPEFSLFHSESKFKTNFNIDIAQMNVNVSYGVKQQYMHHRCELKPSLLLTFAQCSMVTTTLVPELDTRSIAPPIPLTIFP